MSECDGRIAELEKRLTELSWFLEYRLGEYEGRLTQSNRRIDVISGRLVMLEESAGRAHERVAYR